MNVDNRRMGRVSLTPPRLEETKVKSKQTKAFIQIVLNHWHWFAISITLAALSFILLKQLLPDPSTEYYAKITARYQRPAGAISISSSGDYALAKPIWQNIALPDNRELYKLLNSTTIVEDAGRALNYEVGYYQRGLLTKRNIWDERPFDIYFHSAGPEDEFSISVIVEPQGLSIRNIDGIKTQDSLRLAESKGAFFVPFDSPTKTPLGLITATRVAHPKPRTIAQEKPQSPITEVWVTKTSDFDARVALDANIKLNNDHDLLLVALETPASSGFALAFLAKIVEISEKHIRTRIAEELSQANANIDSALALLAGHEGAISDSDRRSIESLGVNAERLDREALRKALHAFKLTNAVDSRTINSQPLVAYVDRPHVGLTSGDSSIFLLAVLLLVAILIPTLLLYTRIVLRRRVIIPEEVAISLEIPLLGEIPSPRANLSQHARDKVFGQMAFQLDSLIRRSTLEAQWPYVITVTSMAADSGVAYTCEQVAAALLKQKRKVLMLYIEDGYCKVKDTESATEATRVSVSLLDQEGMSRLIDRMAGEYDYLVIDVPSAQETNDVYALEPYTSVFVWVVRHMKTTLDQIESVSVPSQQAPSLYVYNRR